MVGPEARLREGLFNPLSHCFMGEGWGEGAGEPAKIATVPDSSSAPVRLCIWQRPKTHTLTLSLVVRERASMSASLRNSMRAIFTLQTVFRQSLVRERASIGSSTDNSEHGTFTLQTVFLTISCGGHQRAFAPYFFAYYLLRPCRRPLSLIIGAFIQRPSSIRYQPPAASAPPSM